MLRSMTGFGRAGADRTGGRLEVEVRTVNHRFLKLHTRLPEGWTHLAVPVDRAVRSAIARGAVSLELRWEPTDGGGEVRIDRDVLARLLEGLVEAAREHGLGVPTDITRLALLPGVVVLDRDASRATRLEWEEVEPVVQEALARLVASREAEGATLKRALERSLEQVEAGLKEIRGLLPEALSEFRDRFRARLQALLGESGLSVSEADVVREAALHAERTDIEEEIERLQSHVRAARETLDRDGPAGRKLEFLAQEMLREANTMASKSQHTRLVEKILSVKLAVDQIREQVQNVE